MNTNPQTLQGLISIAALLCLVVGFFNLFNPTINDLLYGKVFYILIGISFFLQAPTLSNKNFLYPMYIAAGLCVVGALLPKDSDYASLKTIGLFAGVILSLFSRPKTTEQQ